MESLNTNEKPKDVMTEWLKQNSWSIIIAFVGVITTFSLYGYRIGNLEKQSDEQKAAIQLLNTQQTQVQVQLAQISTDTQYLKSGLDRLQAALDRFLGN